MNLLTSGANVVVDGEGIPFLGNNYLNILVE